MSASRPNDSKVVVQRNAESSPAVMLYRRLLPPSARAAVAERVSPESRNRIVTRIAGSIPTATAEVRRRLFDLRHAEVLGSPGRVLVTLGNSVKVAQIVEDTTPLMARRENLDRVCDALRAADVAFFCVRGLSDLSSAVAVSEADRAHVLAALQDVTCRTPGYVSQMHKNEREPRASLPGYEQATWKQVERAPVLRLSWFRTNVDGTYILGHEHGCDVEFWEPADEVLKAPRRNRVTASVPLHGATVEAPGALFTNLEARDRPDDSRYPTRPEFTAFLVQDLDFPIDAVYTWVDGSDEAWRTRRDEALHGAGGQAALNEEAANAARYLSRDELRYSLRSMEMYAPWIRTIHLVTDRQIPDWLVTDHPRIKIVDHRDIFTDPTALPTFNSHAIESQLHHIDGLAEHFLYLNDDVFLGRAVTPDLFFHTNGVAKFFPSPAQIPPGEPSLDDPPVVSAGKNNRALVEKLFGRVITQKIKHAPHPLRRSVLAEMEERFADLHAGTAAHRFRHPGDISVTSSLHHWYGYFTHRSVVGEIRYTYADLAARHTPRRLNRILEERALDAFCLNDTESQESSLGQQLKLLHWFLSAYYPVRAPWEKPASGR